MTKDYALLGSWRWFDSNDDCGITVCEAGKSGDLKVISINLHSGANNAHVY